MSQFVTREEFEPVKARIYELTGHDGRGGWVYRADLDIEALKRIQFRLVVYACAGASAGGGVVAALLKFFA